MTYVYINHCFSVVFDNVECILDIIGRREERKNVAEYLPRASCWQWQIRCFPVAFAL